MISPRSLILLAIALVLLGCRTEFGDRGFDPYAMTAENAAEKRDEDLFVPLGKTNGVAPDLLTRPKDLFRLGPGDIISLKILGDETSATRALVGPDGKIYFNVLRGTFVWGRTLSESKQLLEQGLAKELTPPPRLSIMLSAVASRRIWIMGQVQEPGVYNLVVPMTLLEAISSAGGFAAVPGSSQINADLKNSFVIRGDRRIEVDFERLINRGDFSQNIFLQQDDFVFLAPSRIADVYVLGAVLRPGNVGLSERMSLAREIANAGGVVKYGFATHVAIVRGSLTDPKIAVIDFKAVETGRALDVFLQAGDVVYVPFVPYRKVAELADHVLNQFVSTIAINEGRNAIQQGGAPVGVSVGLGQIAPAPR